MPKVKLDHAFCLSAQCEPGKKRTDYYDISTTGFTLACHQSGTKSFEFRFQDSYGKLRQRRIAPHGEVSFSDAQKIARQWRAEVIMGGDPAAQKAEKKAVPTYGQWAVEHHLEFARTHLRRPENVESVIRVHLIPRFGAERVDSITAQSVAKWLADKRAAGLAPATVEKLRVTLNRSFELMLKHGTAGVKQNPVQSIPRQKIPAGRTRFLTPSEAERLLIATEESLNPMLRSIVALLLLCGMRKSELLLTAWRDVDLDGRRIFVPQSKTGRSRYVPLCRQAIEVIKCLPRYDGVEWMIVNKKTKKPYTDIKHPWETARHKAGLGGLRIHDLRHASASFLVQAGIDLYAVGRILGHADPKSTMIYSHLSDSALLNAVEAGASHMNVNWAEG